MSKTMQWTPLTAAAALLLSIVALIQIRETKQLALSEVAVEEENFFAGPIWDEETQTLQYLALFDLSITNHSGPAVELTAIRKSPSANQFLTLLKGEEVLAGDVGKRAFLTPHGIGEIKANPRLLKESARDMGEAATPRLAIGSGQSRLVHLAVLLSPYNEQRQAEATTALCSFDLIFDSGKVYRFRRAFPIVPLQ